MTTRYLAVFVGAAAVGGAAAVACGGSHAGEPAAEQGAQLRVASPPSGATAALVADGGASDQCGKSVNCTEPPRAPSGPPTTIAHAHTYAISKIYFGDKTRDGVASSTAWQTLGYDLDGKVTTATSIDVCTPVSGASASFQVDGKGGIDNSWGADLLPLLLSIDSTFTTTENAELASGSFTDLLYVVGFDDAKGSSATATGLTGVLLQGGAFAGDAGAPGWDKTTFWPLLPGDLAGCTATSGCPRGTRPIADAQFQFAGAFQRAGTFSSGTPGQVMLHLGLDGAGEPPFDLQISGALFTFDAAAPGAVKHGIVAGALDVSSMVQLINLRIAQLGICGGPTLASVDQQIQEMADIVVEGNTISNQAGVGCNAISIGLGFDAVEIGAPRTADILGGEPAYVDPCGDGGL